MGKYASEIVKVMQSWIGKKESNGSHKSIIDTYNSHKPLARGYKVKYTDSWCATTVSAAAITLGYTDIIPTECSCGQMIALLKNKGVWMENDAYTPNPGDIIMYDWDDSGKGDNTGWPEHVGLVEKVSNGVITVIEGNLNNTVGRREIKVNAKNIRGYGVPKYDKEVVQAPEAPSANKTYFARYGGSSGSIVSALKAIGEKSDYNYRCTIAAANGIDSYSGTAAQNTKMLSLIKQGYLIKPTSVSGASYFVKYTGSSNSIADALKSIGVDSSYAYRKKIAKANGISLYAGTSSQNTKLLSLLKQGALLKP